MVIPIAPLLGVAGQVLPGLFGGPEQFSLRDQLLVQQEIPFQHQANIDGVAKLYWDILGRAPDPIGLASYVGMLDSRSMTPQDVERQMRASPEYQEVQKVVAVMKPVGIVSDVKWSIWGIAAVAGIVLLLFWSK